MSGETAREYMDRANAAGSPETQLFWANIATASAMVEIAETLRTIAGPDLAPRPTVTGQRIYEEVLRVADIYNDCMATEPRPTLLATVGRIQDDLGLSRATLYRRIRTAKDLGFIPTAVAQRGEA